MLWRSYTFCSDGLSPDSPPSVLAGMGCTYNQTRAQKVGSEVQISTSQKMSKHRTFVKPPIGYLREVWCSTPALYIRIMLQSRHNFHFCVSTAAVSLCCLGCLGVV